MMQNDVTQQSDRVGKKCTDRLYEDAKMILVALPDRLVTNIWTASIRDFLWGVVDQRDYINTQVAEIAALQARVAELEAKQPKKSLVDEWGDFHRAQALKEPTQ